MSEVKPKLGAEVGGMEMRDGKFEEGSMSGTVFANATSCADSFVNNNLKFLAVMRI